MNTSGTVTTMEQIVNNTMVAIITTVWLTRFLSSTGSIAIEIVTTDRNVVTSQGHITIATCMSIVKVLLTNTGTIASGIDKAVINTKKTWLTTVKLDQVSVSGLNATNLRTTKLTLQSVVQEKKNANITIATSMEMIVKMNFGTNVTGKSWIALG